ncbi:MAG: asparaginase [Acholeplasmataceae bacterium]
MKKKTVVIIFTGGTISMEKHGRTKKAIITDNQDELLDSIRSELKGIDLIPFQFSMKPSPSMRPDDMLKLARLTEQYLEDPKVNGVVITHGTDTLEESAYFLDLYLSQKKPAVFTGSMRNFSELGYDGMSNLVSSILVASSQKSRNRGVLVVLNDEINAASEVTKSDTLALDTFKSLQFGPIGIIDQETVLYYRRTPVTTSHLRPEELVESVEIVKAYAGSDSLLLNFLVDHGVRGIVLEALGRGNIPPLMVDGVKQAIANSIPVVLTSRCPIGRVIDTYDYAGGGYHLSRLGVIFVNNLNSQKARIKLMFALSVFQSHAEIETFFKR